VKTGGGGVAGGGFCAAGAGFLVGWGDAGICSGKRLR